MEARGQLASLFFFQCVGPWGLNCIASPRIFSNRHVTDINLQEPQGAGSGEVTEGEKMGSVRGTGGSEV